MYIFFVIYPEEFVIMLHLETSSHILYNYRELLKPRVCRFIEKGLNGAYYER
jgi:hypothetical protein